MVCVCTAHNNKNVANFPDKSIKNCHNAVVKLKKRADTEQTKQRTDS